MLILTRRSGETLMIGDDVSVTVLGVKGNQVRIGVEAPRDILVHRDKFISAFKTSALRRQVKQKRNETDAAQMHG